MFLTASCHSSFTKLSAQEKYKMTNYHNFTRESEKTVELRNPNTCAEAKLSLFFIYAGSRNSLPQD